jgi:pimeloyl-ACP methyl ester carboxylesterase
MLSRNALLSAMSLLAATHQHASPPPPDWPEGVTELRIRSTADGSDQPALTWSPTGEEARPLLVGLHTWGGDYRQTSNGAVFARWCMAQGWHFVFPHFRGPNRTPEALGSDLAVQDIADAVAHLRRTQPVDADRIYLIGASGGGHMAMLMAGRHPDLWAGVSAWVGISDVAAWHAEHLKEGHPDNYARNIEAALGGPPDTPERLAEARRRSPLSWLHGARGVNLDLHHGLHDGRTGSVPFRHSLLAFNAAADESDRLDPTEIEAFYASQTRPSGWPAAAADPLYGNIALHFRRESGQVRVTIFEGGHEILYTPGLNWLAAQRRGHNAVWRIDTLIPVAGDTASGR